MFSGKIINASLKFLIKLPTQKAEFLQKFFYKISQTNFKSFSNQRFDTASKFISTISFSFWIYMKHLFMFNIPFKSHLIRYSGTGHAFKDIQRALEHLRHSEGTRALGHFGTRRAFGHLGTLFFLY